MKASLYIAIATIAIIIVTIVVWTCGTLLGTCWRKKKLEAVLEAAKPLKPLDGQAMRKLLGYGEDVLAEIIEIFVASAPTSIADMGLALENSSAADVAMAAHTLKGSCSYFGTSTLRELCAQIEQMGQKGNIDGAGDLIVSAEKELSRLIKALEPYRKTKVAQ